MRGPFTRGIAVGAALTAAAACALPSVNEYASRARPPDAGPPDAGGVVAPDGAPKDPAPSADAGSDAGAPIVNLLEGSSANFDDGTCGEGGGFRASTNNDHVARSGAGSCRVCRQPVDGFFTLDTYFLAPVPAGTYHARAWVRRPPGVTQTFGVFVFLRLGEDDFAQIEERKSTAVLLTDEWQPVTVDLVVSKPVPHMDTYLGGEPDKGTPACFLVDDYEVWRD